MKYTPFEAEWRNRFERFGRAGQEDADIAGWSQTSLRARISRFLEVWKPSRRAGSWVDVGCGAGTYSRLLAEQGMEVLGIDYSLPSIAKACLRGDSNVLWIVGNATRLPLRSERYDGVLCFGVTQALSESEALIAELVRITQPGGQVWIDALNKWCIPHAVENLHNRLRSRSGRLRYESVTR